MAVPSISGSGPASPAGSPSAARPSFGEVLRTVAGPPDPRPAAFGPAAAALDRLRMVEEAQRRLDALLAEARRGRAFTAQELLCLQADAYRCAQVLDVTARATEHVVQGVKQAAATQV